MITCPILKASEQSIEVRTLRKFSVELWHFVLTWAVALVRFTFRRKLCILTFLMLTSLLRSKGITAFLETLVEVK